MDKSNPALRQQNNPLKHDLSADLWVVLQGHQTKYYLDHLYV